MRVGQSYTSWDPIKERDAVLVEKLFFFEGPSAFAEGHIPLGSFFAGV